jgi:hypothetical protein
MAQTDYETVYDNRARLPGHLQIFGRRAKDAAAFPATMSAFRQQRMMNG